ncbi:unnamed protein product [Linum tenue]|uniref:Uncharacterized protein n=1 Tax=Linum tenue TaxID=586396 RepID=A0AAV0Q8B5_9ROSI|nr:unnamed protein product [Linum tenue]
MWLDTIKLQGVECVVPKVQRPRLVDSWSFSSYSLQLYRWQMSRVGSNCMSHAGHYVLQVEHYRFAELRGVKQGFGSGYNDGSLRYQSR